MSGVLLFQRHYTRKSRAAICGFICLLLFIVFSGQVPYTMAFSKQALFTPDKPENFPSFFQAPDGANDANYKGGKAPILVYTLDEAYPTEMTIDSIGRQFESAGWKELEYDFYDPEVVYLMMNGPNSTRPMKSRSGGTTVGSVDG